MRSDVRVLFLCRLSLKEKKKKNLSSPLTPNLFNRERVLVTRGKPHTKDVWIYFLHKQSGERKDKGRKYGVTPERHDPYSIPLLRLNLGHPK